MVVPLRINLLPRLGSDGRRAHVLLVLHREAVLLEWVQLAVARVLNSVQRLASLLHRGRRHVIAGIRVCIVALSAALLQLCESTLVDALDELSLDWHIWILMQHLITPEEQVIFCVLLLTLGLDDLTRCIVARVVDRE